MILPGSAAMKYDSQYLNILDFPDEDAKVYIAAVWKKSNFNPMIQKLISQLNSFLEDAQTQN